ncbi:hypothetical protein [Brevundimonas sp.]|uniref:hypothetical protein n=1 Tax=Brevundimonas sp. TaxID=1871086 RepID=UPI002D223E96|nr:hypothetical protein [Brevundimonas sp.]HYC68584.1 hypothetical protein [Brevundimonas sp.]
MTEVVKFHYRTSAIAYPFIGFSALSILLVWSPFGSTYYRFLEHYPGRLIVFGIVAIYVVCLVWRLPTFVRALARIPAVQHDGRVLLIRGWEDRSFSMDRPIDVRVDEERQRIEVSVNSGRAASILLRDIEGPRTLISFLESLAASTR